MNEFQSIEGGAGLLKRDYNPEETPVSRALRQRTRKLAAKVKIESLQNDGEENG